MTRQDNRIGSEIFPTLALAICGVVVACLIAEITIRLSSLAKPQFYTYSASRGWKLAAGASGFQLDEGRAFVRVNRWGYRGPDWTLAKPPATLRVAVLGDSFTEAQQVPEDETFSAVAQRMLTRELGTFAHGRYASIRQVEVMNFGVDGYGTTQELLTLDDAWRFSPDVIVLAFFAGNDFRNNSVVLEGDKCRPFFVEDKGDFVLGGPFIDSGWFRFQCFARFESRHSQLLNELGSAKSILRTSLKRWEAARGGRGDASASPQAARPAAEPGLSDNIYRPPSSSVWREAWDVTDAEIEMMHQAAVRHGASFMVAALGSGMQVMPDPSLRQRFLRGVGGTSLFYAEDRLIALGQAHGFPVVAIAPAMQPCADARSIYFHGFPNTVRGTGHWNARGNCFAGLMIGDAIARMLADPAGAARLAAANEAWICEAAARSTAARCPP